MASVITNWGEIEALRLLFDSSKSPTLHLMSNMTGLGGTSSLSDIIESNFPGYAPIVLNALPAPVTGTDGRAAINAGLKTFTRTAGVDTQNVAGFYITLVGAQMMPMLYAALIFASPILVNAAGQTVDVTLKLISTDTV